LDEAETGETGTGFTITAIEFEVAGFPEAQVTFDVKTQVMISPFAREASV
jgi:hypothetical protein